VLANDGSSRLGGDCTAAASLADLIDSALDPAEEDGLMSSAVDVVGVCGLGCSTLPLDGDAMGESMSSDGGRTLLLVLLHVDLPLAWIALASALASFNEVPETSSSVMAFG
jgi:hypothetical protein